MLSLIIFTILKKRGVDKKTGQEFVGHEGKNGTNTCNKLEVVYICSVLLSRFHLWRLFYRIILKCFVKIVKLQVK